MPRKQWRCFFCDDVFTSREAAGLHFGSFDACEPDVTACKLMANQQHVIEYIRGLEQELSQYQAENVPSLKAMYAVEDEMRRAVTKAEEGGYARGLAAGVADPYALVDWVYLHALDGQAWPDVRTADKLIELAKRHPTQADADAMKRATPE